MIIGLDTGLWVCLVRLVIFFLNCYLLSEFSKNIGCLLPPLLTCLVGIFNREYLLMFKAGRSGRQEDMILAVQQGT